MIIEYHDQEANVLRRRLELLETLDEMIKSSIRNGSFLEVDDDEIEHITSEFRSVLTPSDVCNSIKKIYPERLFSERKSRFSRS